MFHSSLTLNDRGAFDSRLTASLLLLASPFMLIGCSPSIQQNNSTQSPSVTAEQSPGIKTDAPKSVVKTEEGTPRIVYDERGRIKGLFGLRIDPSGDPTCKLEEYTVGFVNIERNQYLVFSLPSTRHVWVEVEGEMQKIFSDPENTKAREFLSKGKKYKMKAYSCDAIGHTSYETVSVELLN